MRRKKKINWRQPMMKCLTLSGRHGRGRRSCKERKGNPTLRANYHRVARDYTFQIPREHNASIHMGKPPHFDGTGYNQWKTKIFGYLSAIHKDLWKIIEVGCDILDDDETPTPAQAYVLQRNYQALNILHSSISAEEFDKIEDALTTKDAWDPLQVNHQGSRH
jgi:hypothetical protein